MLFTAKNCSKLLKTSKEHGIVASALLDKENRIALTVVEDYKNNEIDAVIELESGEWCAFEIKLGAKKIDEGAENLISVCNDIVAHGGKAPKIMCVICGLSNATYQRPDGVYVVPITALKN